MMAARTGERPEATHQAADENLYIVTYDISHRRGGGGACSALWKGMASGCSYRYSNAG